VGLLIDREIEDGCRIGLWEITEDYETLFRMTYMNDDDMHRLNSFRSINRKIESLSVRALLQQMTRPDARIVYQPKSHKPYLYDGSYNISVSHSHNYTTILLGKNKLVGVDLEYMTHDIERLAHKFINERELITDNPQTRRNHLYIHWCAKEALYKIYSKRELDFQKNMLIHPFEIGDMGEITGIVYTEFGCDEYKLHYSLGNNYAWVYCFK